MVLRQIVPMRRMGADGRMRVFSGRRGQIDDPAGDSWMGVQWRQSDLTGCTNILARPLANAV